MKSFLIIASMLVTFYSSSFAQKNIEQVFRGYKNDKGVLALNFTGDYVNMLSKSDKKFISKVDNIEIILFDSKNNISKQDQSKIQSVLSRDKYELLVDIKNKGVSSKVFAVDNGPYLSKVYAYGSYEEYNAHFILSGKIIFEELAALGLNFQDGKFDDFIKKKDVQP